MLKKNVASLWGISGMSTSEYNFLEVLAFQLLPKEDKCSKHQSNCSLSYIVNKAGSSNNRQVKETKYISILQPFCV